MIRRNITYKEKSLIIPLYKAIVTSGVAKGGAGGANAPPQIFVVPLLQKKPLI